LLAVFQTRIADDLEAAGRTVTAVAEVERTACMFFCWLVGGGGEVGRE
jgi:hypothetical protein